MPFSRVTTDTRGLARGDLFVALKGERFDGHDFVAQALRDGAAAALVDAAARTPHRGNLIAVDDPLRALGALARVSGAAASTFRSRSSPAATARRRRRR